MQSPSYTNIHHPHQHCLLLTPASLHDKPGRRSVWATISWMVRTIECGVLPKVPIHAPLLPHFMMLGSFSHYDFFSAQTLFCACAWMALRICHGPIPSFILRFTDHLQVYIPIYNGELVLSCALHPPIHPRALPHSGSLQ